MTLILLTFLAVWLASPLLYKLLGNKSFYLLATIPALALGYLFTRAPAILGGSPWQESITWIPQLNLALTFRMDTLSWVMSLLVLGVGSLVLFYCAAYFKHSKDGVRGFSAYLFGFAGAMFGLITADDFIIMFIFWEITTILSYLLIGYSRHRLSARRSALQALTLTTAGGLAMFVGIIMLGQSLGTYSLAELVERGPETLAGALSGTGPLGYGQLSAALFLILCGALSKSALFPLHFWLPGAMAAPTPVSAYLHAAAMVKAGIYLLLRLAPGYGNVEIWQNTLLLLGSFTMLFGGWVALKQTDLKLILAYGTVSQLGFMALIISTGSADALYAALALVLAHSLFKAALFLTVGIIDHQAGTRDIRKISGIYRHSPVLFIIGTISAASMAGLPPLAGFVAKEAVLETFLSSLHTGQDGVPLTAALGAGAVILGSILTFAYSARFVWGAFASKPESYMVKAHKLKYCALTDKQTTKPGYSRDTLFHPVSLSFIAAPFLLTLLTLAYGLYPEPVHLWNTSYLADLEKPHLHLALWHGITPALLTSLGIILAGSALFWARRPIENIQKALPQAPAASEIYINFMDRLDRLAVYVTGHTQRGSLGFYLGVILVTAVTVPTIVLFVEETPPLANIRVSESPAQWAVVLIMIAAALVVLWARKRFLAILMVSVTGYGISLLFAMRNAPDLALTQLLVETVSMVAFVLAMRVLPSKFPVHENKSKPARLQQTIRIAIAIGFGVLMVALALFTFSSRALPPISLNMPELAYEIGHGKNIVNVTLVDMRGWDTFGEISVLALAATGVASLLYIEGRGDRRRTKTIDTTTIQHIEAAFARRSNMSLEQKVAGRFSSVERDPFIVAGRTLPPEARSILLEVMTRLLFHTMIMVSLYMLVAGHNLPGGGFAGGLLVGLALAIRYLAGGGNELKIASPLSAGTFLGLGLGIASLYAIAPVLWGDPVFSSYVIDFHLPIFGDVHFVTATIFDIGVYLLVIGLVLDVLRSLGIKVDEKLEALRRQQARQARAKEKK